MTTFDEHERARWSGRATAFRDSFAALCAHPAGALLDTVRVRAGGRLLDVGTGTGTVAALAYGRGVKVVAVDAEDSMVNATRRRVPEAEVQRAVLPSLPFEDGTFDAVVGNFVVNHVGDPLAAVREMRRVTRAGGGVAVTIWPVPVPAAQQLWSTVFDAAGVERPDNLPRLPPDRDFPRTAAGFAELLRRAGLGDVDCESLFWTHRTDPESWWSGPANGIGTPGLILQRQDAATVARVRARYEEHILPFLDADGHLGLPTSALLASGRA